MYKRIFKRSLDFILSFSAALLLFPIFIILAVIIRCGIGSPILFSQERPGKDEKIFKLYKFRSMTNARNAQGELLPDEKRLTKIGKFLRASSLDELPELLNIIKGDMSIVGPRPLLPEYLPYYSSKQRHRHDVRPGLTGLAQVNGRNGISWGEKFDYDLQYIRHITFWGDVKIIIKTIGKVILREGIHGTDTITMDKFRGNDETPSKEKEMP